MEGFLPDLPDLIPDGSFKRFVMINNKKFIGFVFTAFLLMVGNLMADTGTVRWFDRAIGYGYVTPDNAQKDVFVTIDALRKSRIGNLHDGDRVKYDVSEKNGKIVANNIEFLK
jgi:CspA family cold shock protein